MTRGQTKVCLTKADAYANLLIMMSIVRYFNKKSPLITGAGSIASVLLLLIVVFAVSCGSDAQDPNGSGTAAESAGSGTTVETVYDFPINFYQGQGIVGGETVPLSELRGQPIVLNFWAGLCPPCRAEMPEFQHFADEYSGRALVVGVDLGQFFSLGNQEDAIELLNELSVTYPAGFTDDAAVVRELAVLALPATLFINDDGSLHRKWQGILNGDKLAEITDEMLAQ